MDDQTAVAEPPLPPQQPAGPAAQQAQPTVPTQATFQTGPASQGPQAFPTPEPSAAAAAAQAAAAAAAASAAQAVRSAVDGISGAQVKRAVLEAVAVVGGALAALTVLLFALAQQVTASAGPLEDVPVSLGDAARAASLVLGLAAGGTASLEAELSVFSYGVGLGAGLTVAPLLLTGLLVAGWAVAARVGAPAPDRRSAAVAAVLSGAASGVLLLVVCALGAVTALPPTGVRDLDDVVESTVSFRLGVEPLRLVVVGALLAGVTAAAVRLWPHLRATAASDRVSRHLATWRLPLELAARFVLVGAVAVALAVVVLLATWEDGPSDLAGWLAVVAVLPTVALAGLLVSLGVTLGLDTSGSGDLVSLLDDIGVLGDLPDLDRAGALRLGLLDGWHPDQLWWAPVGALVVLVATSMLTALRHDPRAQAQQGLWWRTGVTFATAGAAITALTTMTLALHAEPTASAREAISDLTRGESDLAGAMVFTAGPALVSTAVCTFVAGVVAALVLVKLPRAAAGVAPWAFVAASRLPGGVHPLWALLLVDASARLGRTAPAALRAQAGEAVAQADGLVPLTVDASRTQRVAVGAGLVIGLGVVLPVGHHVLSTTVFGPDAALQRYAAAFSDGDATALRAAAGAPASPTLEQEALDAQRAVAPVSSVSAVLDDDEGSSGESRTGVVSFRVDGEAQQQHVSLVQTDEKSWGVFPQWEVRSQLPSVDVTAPALVSGLSVNGVRTAVLPDTPTEVPVFPGRTDVTAEVPAHLSVPAWSATLVGGQSGEAQLAVGISPEGNAAVQKAVTGWLSKCERSTALNPPGCPLGYSDYYINASNVRWSYTDATSSNWTAGVEEDGSVRVFGTAEGTVSYDYTYFSLDQPRSTSSSGDARYRGTITFDGDGGVTFRMGS